MKLEEQVAHNIRDIRVFRGLSQEDLANNAEISGAHMGRLENTKNSITLAKLGSTARTLDVDPFVLLLPRWRPKGRLVRIVMNRGGCIEFSDG